MYLCFNIQDSFEAIAAINYYDLHKFSIYSEEHFFKLNGGGTTVITFGRKTDRNVFLYNFGRSLHINNNIIEFRDSVRNLGLHIDDDLRFI